MSDRTRGGPLRVALDRCLGEASVSDASRVRMAATVDRAAAFFERLGIGDLSNVTPLDASAFVTARLVGGGAAGISLSTIGGRSCERSSVLPGGVAWRVVIRLLTLCSHGAHRVGRDHSPTTRLSFAGTSHGGPRHGWPPVGRWPRRQRAGSSWPRSRRTTSILKLGGCGSAGPLVQRRGGVS